MSDLLTSSTDPTDRLVVGLLGPVVLFQDEPVGVPAKLDRTLLTHLLLAEGRAVPVGMLIDAVWGQHPPLKAANALQAKVSRIRKLLAGHGHALVYSQGTYQLRLARDQVDAGAFSDLLGRASSSAQSGDFEGARGALEQAVQLWRGAPLSELDEHPRIVAARARFMDEWLTLQELIAEVELATGNSSPDVLARLRKALEKDPLRAKARLLLMRALDVAGRRAEALAVYDAGRRTLADQTGLAPPPELQEAFDALLAAERRAARRLPVYEVTQAVPPGALDTARWLAADGDTSVALELAVRGSWWWWFGGQRSAGRDLLEELVGNPEVDRRHALRASAWLAVFESVEADAESALRRGEEALQEAARLGWSKHESLAALLLAERLYQRGFHDRAELLIQSSKTQLAHEGNEWGLALAGVVEAKSLLARGFVLRATTKARALVREFEELGDRAGQIMALDVAGYCAEVEGDLTSAALTHRRALDLARRVQAPEWETSQLTRLGSVLALAGSEDALPFLESAVSLAESIRSDAGLALAQNGLGLAAGLAGDREWAAENHVQAMAWYETQESPAGISYTAGRLATECADPQEALQLATKSMALAVRTRDPRAIAHGLEALTLTIDEPRQSARALGGARALRRRVSAPLPERLRSPLIERERQLAATLGDDLVRELRAGALQSRRFRPNLVTNQHVESDSA